MSNCFLIEGDVYDDSLDTWASQQVKRDSSEAVFWKNYIKCMYGNEISVRSTFGYGGICKTVERLCQWKDTVSIILCIDWYTDRNTRQALNTFVDRCMEICEQSQVEFIEIQGYTFEYALAGFRGLIPWAYSAAERTGNEYVGKLAELQEALTGLREPELWYRNRRLTAGLRELGVTYREREPFERIAYRILRLLTHLTVLHCEKNLLGSCWVSSCLERTRCDEIHKAMKADGLDIAVPCGLYECASPLSSAGKCRDICEGSRVMENIDRQLRKVAFPSFRTKPNMI